METEIRINKMRENHQAKREQTFHRFLWPEEIRIPHFPDGPAVHSRRKSFFGKAYVCFNMARPDREPAFNSNFSKQSLFVAHDCEDSITFVLKAAEFSSRVGSN